AGADTRRIDPRPGRYRHAEAVESAIADHAQVRFGAFRYRAREIEVHDRVVVAPLAVAEIDDLDRDLRVAFGRIDFGIHLVVARIGRIDPAVNRGTEAVSAGAREAPLRTGELGIHRSRRHRVVDIDLFPCEVPGFEQEARTVSARVFEIRLPDLHALRPTVVAAVVLIAVAIGIEDRAAASPLSGRGDDLRARAHAARAVVVADAVGVAAAETERMGVVARIVAA